MKSDLKKMNPQTSVDLDSGITIYIRPFPWKYMGDGLEIFNRYFSLILDAQSDVQAILKLLTSHEDDGQSLQSDIERLILISLHPRTWEHKPELKEIEWLEDCAIAEVAQILSVIFEENRIFFLQKMQGVKLPLSVVEKSSSQDQTNGQASSSSLSEAAIAGQIS